MSRKTTQFIASLLGLNQKPPAPAPPNPASAGIPVIADAKQVSEKYPNPAADPALATKLTEVNNSTIATPEAFNEERPYSMFVPKALVNAYNAAPTGSKPRPKLSLFFGVGVELTLFRIRDFFANETNSVIIVISGVETESSNPPAADDPWAGIHNGFGYGISNAIIEKLFAKAGMPEIKIGKFDVEVMGGYSTGYRGVNLTVINELVDITKLKRLIYFDAWYFHNDHPLMPSGSPYRGKNTLLAVDTALTKSPAAQLVIYGVTEGGVPRTGGAGGGSSNAPKVPVASLMTTYPNRVKFVDIQFKSNTKPSIDTQVQKICLARLISFGIPSKFTADSLEPGIRALVDALPAKGELGTLGGAGYTDVYTWINNHTAEINGFDASKGMNIMFANKLLRSWSTTNPWEMRHRMFIIELGKEPLLP